MLSLHQKQNNSDLLLVSLQPKMSPSAGDFIRWGRKDNIEDKDS